MRLCSESFRGFICWNFCFPCLKAKCWGVECEILWGFTVLQWICDFTGLHCDLQTLTVLKTGGELDERDCEQSVWTWHLFAYIHKHSVSSFPFAVLKPIHTRPFFCILLFPQTDFKPMYCLKIIMQFCHEFNTAALLKVALSQKILFDFSLSPLVLSVHTLLFF